METQIRGCALWPQKENSPSPRTWLVTYTLSSSSKNWTKELGQNQKAWEHQLTPSPHSSTERYYRYIEYFFAIPSPQGNIKVIIPSHDQFLQQDLNADQTVAWVTSMPRQTPAQLVELVSLLPPACPCVSSPVPNSPVQTPSFRPVCTSFSAKTSLLCKKCPYAFQPSSFIYIYI